MTSLPCKILGSLMAKAHLLEAEYQVVMNEFLWDYAC